MMVLDLGKVHFIDTLRTDSADFRTEDAGR